MRNTIARASGDTSRDELARSTRFEYLVAIQIKANRRHKKEPQAQYATGLGLGSLLPQLRLLSWAALSVGDGCRPARPNADYLVRARGQSNARNEADRYNDHAILKMDAAFRAVCTPP